MKRSLLALAFVAAFSVLASQVSAQDKPAEKKDTKPPAPAAKPADKPAGDKPAAAKPGDKPAGGPSEADMAKYMEAATPGPAHAALKPLVGNFACDIKMMFPGSPPQVSSGTMKREMILDGRYLSETVESTFDGMPFKGQGIFGYDNGQKLYQSIWIDNMGTGIASWTGKSDGKTFTLEGDNYDPAKGKKEWGRITLELTTNDKHVMKMFAKGPDGKELQNFEMTCTRK